jgi:hypothetical protein
MALYAGFILAVGVAFHAVRDAPVYAANAASLRSFDGLEGELAQAVPAGTEVQVATYYLERRGFQVVYNDQERLALAFTRPYVLSLVEAKRYRVALFYDDQHRVTEYRAGLEEGGKGFPARPRRQDYG